MYTRSAAPPPSPPSMVYGSGCPRSCGVGCGSLFPLWAGCGGFGVLGLADAVESRVWGSKGIRLRVDKGLGRVWV